MINETSRSGPLPTPRLRLVGPLENRPDAGPTNHRPAPRRRLPPEVLSETEVCELMQACGRYAPIGIRNRALIALLYRTGMRINEALSLYPKDLDLENGSIRVLHGKGGKWRTVGLDPGAGAVIEHWLDARAQCLARSIQQRHDATLTASRSPRSGKRITRVQCQTVTLLETAPSYADDGNQVASGQTFGRHPLFCTLDGNRIAAAYVRRLLKRLASRAGIEKRVHAHGLRHTHAAQLRAEGIDIGIISRQLGHSSISTTARYLDHLAPTAVIDAMRRRHWTGA